MSQTSVNAMTVDVEDYFHVAALSRAIAPSQWDSMECRVERNMEYLLELLAEYNVRGTFFVLGWVAERYPSVVKKIVELGHEVASHGYSHQLIYTQSMDVFRTETVKSKRLLEDITQSPVVGYRAASYSITRQSLWAIDVLLEAGFEYDSSIFPVRHDRYGVPGSPDVPYVITGRSGNEIIEVPPTTLNLMGYKLPIGGGGYFRLFPYWFTRWGLNRVMRENGKFVFYLHPWEIDPSQPKIKKISMFSKFRHYNNLEKCDLRLRKLLQDFQFSTMRELVDVTKSSGLANRLHLSEL